MAKRSSFVDHVSLNDVAIASNFNIGDSEKIFSRAFVFAVQREAELYYGFEGSLNEYPIFSEVIPIPAITERVNINRNNLNSSIRVSSINIIGISTASVFQIGNTGDAYLESRVHHVRQLFGENK